VNERCPLPDGCRLEPLRKSHPRSPFCSGQTQVDDWLATKALHNQDKRLSATKALIAAHDDIAGFYALATAQVDFADLPAELIRHPPRRDLPVAVLAWLGVDKRHTGQGLGRRLLAQALAHCHVASRTFPVIAVVLDCIDEPAKAFYRHWDFRELPGYRQRLYLSCKQLDAMMEGR
jgi:GNAT superfamily N-acetyltransferase